MLSPTPTAFLRHVCLDPVFCSSPFHRENKQGPEKPRGLPRGPRGQVELSLHLCLGTVC